MRSIAALCILAGACGPLGGGRAEETRVPPLLRQGVTHAAQAVSAIDVTADGKRIAVATLAYRHERNFWLLGEDGTPEWGRNVLPWAPFQAAVLEGAKAFGAGMAYSRVTSPHPTISLFRDAGGAETVLEDSAAEVGWLRYGEGDWKTGWMASLIGDLLLKSGGSLFTVSGHNGPVELDGDGQVKKASLPHPRPFRMAAGGGRQALGYVAGDPASARVSRAVLVVRDAKGSWSAEPLKDLPAPPPLPEPARDFPEFSESFNLKPDAIAPFRVAASVAISADGSRTAITEYGGWLWIRKRPAIGRWDPPFHVIPFVPRQKGWLRVFDATGRELAKAELPKAGLFEVRTDGKGVWCSPMSWFARGMAGVAWRPADEVADTVFPFDPTSGWGEPRRFPDAVADLAVQPTDGMLLVSCWDGKLYLGGTSVAVGGPARVCWSADGRTAVAGTEAGEVFKLDAAGALVWRRKLPVLEPPPLAEPLKPVFEGIPIYRVGRVGPEHAYVGDLWLIKTERGGVLVDAGGTSSVSLTLQKIRAAGVDPQGITHVLQTHSHGDHAGGAYLWRTRGARIVAPETAAFAMTWVMPMLSDYGIWVPRPVDVPLPLKRPGDEATFEAGGVRIRAIFVPGHSFDSVVYAMELGGKRVAFTGDMGFLKESHILHRCWGDAERAKVVVRVVREKLLPFKPDVLLTGHDTHPDGAAFLEDLVRRTEAAMEK